MGKRIKVLGMKGPMGPNIDIILLTDNQRNPYRVYLWWKDCGYLRKRQIAAYGDMASCLHFLRDMYLAGANGWYNYEIIAWAKQYYNT